jgi:hypothetical protein
MMMTRVAFALLASATLAVEVQPAAAEIYRPWCVQYGGSNGDNGTTCAFTSFEQCMMTARGGGGFCVQNPWYLAYGSGQKSPREHWLGQSRPGALFVTAARGRLERWRQGTYFFPTASTTWSPSRWKVDRIVDHGSAPEPLQHT